MYGVSLDGSLEMDRNNTIHPSIPFIIQKALIYRTTSTDASSEYLCFGPSWLYTFILCCDFSKQSLGFSAPAFDAADLARRQTPGAEADKAELRLC